MTGKFITFEGLDGSGKTTQLQRLATALRADGINVVTTREPGGTPIGEQVRSLLLDSRTRGLSPLAELALMFASRAQQIDETILPAINAGKWVLCDRFTDSSEAYQGGGRQLGSGPILDLHRVLCRDLQPDLTILLLTDVRFSVGRARVRNRAHTTAEGANEGRFEQEQSAFFERVHTAYKTIAERETQRVVAIEASRSIAAVHQEILRAVRERLR